MLERDVRRSRAAQVGILMKSYRESFSLGEGRRGLTQEGLLERMGSVDEDYAERYSHATVSRWESGGTRPTLQRLKVFGAALNLSRAEIAGLVLLAGLARDFRTALGYVTGSNGGEAAGSETAPNGIFSLGDARDASDPAAGSASSPLGGALRFVFLRVLPLGAAIVVCTYALSFFGWNDARMPVVYVALATGFVLGQAFLLPDREVGLREFYWASLFFLLTTPLLQFAPIGMDHYNFHLIGNLAGTPLPHMLALLSNLSIASAAGLMFHLLWKWQYDSDRGGSRALERAAWTTLPPVVFAYAVVFVITNISVSIQLAVLLPVLGAAFALMLVVRDPALDPSERDRLFLLSATSVVAMISIALGAVTILAIYLSPDYPAVLPDHNLLRSWEIDFVKLGHTREEALERLNLGYLWHATWVFGYMVFVVGGNTLLGIYRLARARQGTGPGDTRLHPRRTPG